jgi:hypothetical protein
VVDPFVLFYLAPVRLHLLIYYTFCSTYLVVQKDHTKGDVWYHQLSMPFPLRLHIQTRPFNHPHCLDLIITSHRACAEEAPKHERFKRQPRSSRINQPIDRLVAWSENDGIGVVGRGHGGVNAGRWVEVEMV